jgi:HD superfamily phosphohydrolase
VDNGVAISPKGITALENILFSKYLMYKTVYWHKTVRIATAMIKKAIAMALADGAVQKQDLYGLDDEEFFSRFTSSRFPGARLIEEARKRMLYKQVLRVPFDDDNAAHRALEDIHARLALEGEIAAEAGKALGRNVEPQCIVVDVPERISFELSIPVIDPGQAESEGTDAMSVSHVFNRIGREDFPRSLRAVSVSVRRESDLLEALGRLELSRHFNT